MKKCYFIEGERKRKKKKKREGKSDRLIGEKVKTKKKKLILSMDPTIFNLFTKRSLSNVT